MTRVELHIIGKRHNPLANGIAKLSHGTRIKVCPSNRTIENGIAAEHRFILGIIKTTAALCMPRRMKYLKINPCHAKSLSVMQIFIRLKSVRLAKPA